jgi:hypothetical protein
MVPRAGTLAAWVDDGHIDEMTKANAYRKRAEELGKAMKTRHNSDRARMQLKKKALEDLAETEDWLAGKPGPQTIKRI